MALVLQAQEELVKEGKMKDRYGMVFSSNPEYAPLQKLYKDQLKTLTYFFIFKPGCHACSGLASNLKEFPNVIPLQAAEGKLHSWQGLAPTKKASEDTLNDYARDGTVPVLVIVDPYKNRVSRLVGKQSKEKILETSVNLLKLRMKENRK